ncbi:unnamed protein product, partial [Iphiclides podalirius]
MSWANRQKGFNDLFVGQLQLLGVELLQPLAQVDRAGCQARHVANVTMHLTDKSHRRKVTDETPTLHETSSNKIAVTTIVSVQ